LTSGNELINVECRFASHPMSLLQAYLQKPSTQRVLSRKPGEKGFSLIELVVVVAVLAILAAIAIPAFTSINDNAAQAAAKNTIAQIAKECAVKKANNEDLEFNVPSLNSYDITPEDGDCDADEFEATRKDDASEALPEVIGYQNKTVTAGSATSTAGSKYCTAGDNESFCEDDTW
jgi:prepilin-type N-terminal cleavage/methylation domain-containing protein